MTGRFPSHCANLAKGAIAIAFLALTACGDSSDEGGDTAAGSAGADVESDFDASTVDVMNVDVAAGGVETTMDPATADAGVDMLGQDTPPPAEAEAAPPADNGSTAPQN
ncbi:hypothetical protein ACSMXM_10365 [Pacificimonas sp. ICDLI1SI03]|jgi:ABC-type oligopeptide transport system substrate-binding subunit|tara:strand:+ start:76390 stop:76716 length:327 start_codon:yes stop_codon:yes gene_type:complete